MTGDRVPTAPARARSVRSASGALVTALRGRAVLTDPVLNKGLAFTPDERAALGLTGLLPPAVLTLDQQADRDYRQYRGLASEFARAVFLAAVRDRNEVLFHRVLRDHLAEMLPVVYTPTIGSVIQQYSGQYRRPGGIYLSVDRPDDIATSLGALGHGRDDVDLVLVTDGEGILGIGDWGVGGIEIAIGKLAVYTAAGGLDPARVLPVVLDVGTDNPGLLGDPDYVGNRHARVTGEPYDAFVDAFVRTCTGLFPGALLHWEDLGAANARRVLERYRSSLCTFNDDMQGTGAVALAAVVAGSRRTGTRLRDQRVVVFGAGTAGIGIADQLRAAMVADGLAPAAATARYWCLGRQGLLLAGQRLRDFQVPYARDRAEAPGWPPDGGVDLAEVVRRVHPTVLIGTSGVAGAFDRAVVTELARHVEEPIILAMSNPTELAEAAAADLLRWTDGRALVATGSPSSAVDLDGRTVTVAQANNALVFPGIGLGAVVSRARRVTDGMLVAAAHAVAALSPAPGPGAALLPPVTRVREVTAAVAVAVATAAQADGVARVVPGDWSAAVAAARWEPAYPAVLAEGCIADGGLPLLTA